MIDPNLPALSWILFRRGKNLGSLPWTAILKAFSIEDHYRSASALIKLAGASGGDGPGLSLPEVFILAAYRLRRSRGQLRATPEELSRLGNNLPSIRDGDIEEWIRKRTVFTPQRGGVSSRRQHRGSSAGFFLGLPGVINATEDATRPGIHLGPSTCHYLSADRRIRAEELAFPEDADFPACIVPETPSCFDDLTLAWNRKIFRALHEGAPWDEASDQLIFTGPLSGRHKRRFGDMDPPERFIFNLGLSASLARYRCYLVEVPPLDSNFRSVFWRFMARLAGRGASVLLLSCDRSHIEHADATSFIRDGSFLGTVTRDELAGAASFKWVKCRVEEPSKASILPAHLIRSSPLTGSIWLAVSSGYHETTWFPPRLRERYGIVLQPELSLPSSLEDRLVRKLRERSAPEIVI